MYTLLFTYNPSGYANTYRAPNSIGYEFSECRGSKRPYFHPHLIVPSSFPLCACPFFGTWNSIRSLNELSLYACALLMIIISYNSPCYIPIESWPPYSFRLIWFATLMCLITCISLSYLQLRFSSLIAYKKIYTLVLGVEPDYLLYS